MEQTKDVVRRYMEALDKRDFAAMSSLTADDYVFHGFGVELHGADSVEQFNRSFLEPYPDMQFPVEDLFAEGDRCACRYRCRGTHTGTFMGVSATGKLVDISATCVSRVQNGKLVEAWEEADLLGLLQQIGAAPATGAAATK
jgi:steroid delta-isomerase-like uncharacterized protein